MLRCVGTREVAHVSATRAPTEHWTAQQLRDATPFGVSSSATGTARCRLRSRRPSPRNAGHQDRRAHAGYERVRGALRGHATTRALGSPGRARRAIGCAWSDSMRATTTGIALTCRSAAMRPLCAPSNPSAAGPSLLCRALLGFTIATRGPHDCFSATIGAVAFENEE